MSEVVVESSGKAGREMEVTTSPDDVTNPGSWVPIKAEFVLSKPRPPEPETEKAEEPPVKRKPRQRGQNKQRAKTNRPQLGTRLCPILIARVPPQDASEEEKGRGCRFGDQCYNLHNLEEYWKSRRPDLDGACPIFDIRGWCQYGEACRYAGTHTTAELEQRVDEAKWEAWKASKTPNGSLRTVELNLAPINVLKDLRKRQYDFSDCLDYLKAQGIPTKTEPNTKKDVPSEKEGEEAVEGETEGKVGFHDDGLRVRQAERRCIDWKAKRYLAPLTTVGNLPFRRVCVGLGAEVTCGEMAVATSLLQASSSEWSLIRRHPSEKLFGVQIAGAHPDTLMFISKVLREETDVDFVDLNMGCPIDLICDKGGGCALMRNLGRVSKIVGAMEEALGPVPLTLKFRTGLKPGELIVPRMLEKLRADGRSPALLTLHGRSKEARYTKLADWTTINQCAAEAAPIPFFGCGDVLSQEDYYGHLEGPESKVAGIMLARGALVKPWLFTEISERRTWDISSKERLDLLGQFVRAGLDHWGSDEEGVEKTRRFLLEWLSFLHRYIPVGLLERLPQRMNEKPPAFKGRDDLETLMGSPAASDWVTISAMLLGPPPDNFLFTPKHKANAY